MKNTLTRIATLATLLLAVSFAAFAQEKESDRIKLSVSFVNSEFELNPVNAIENLQGISVDADAKIFSKPISSHVTARLGGVFNYQRNGISQSTPLDTYMAGAQFSLRVGPVEPFVGALFGVNTTYNQDRLFARKYRVGVDIPFHKESNFFVRPFFIEWERTEGLLSPAVRKYGAGAGFRF
jgi:hypothetical protein